MQVNQLAVFGPGLIGGSIALAARRRGTCARLAVWSRDEAERTALRALDVADVVTEDPAQAVRGADLVILCLPPTALAPLAARIAPLLATHAVVSDVASVKAGLVEELTEILGRRFVGAHPMAGAERAGLTAARDDLFARSVCLVTPLDADRTDPAGVEIVARFWEGLGAHVRRLSPGAHDDAVAVVSHLPHLIAAALVGLPDDDVRECAGPGWRDMTRLAAGSPEMWTEILSHNRGPVTYALRQMTSRLGQAIELLEDGRGADLAKFLEEAKRRRSEH